jgi:hypothetical protein
MKREAHRIEIMKQLKRITAERQTITDVKKLKELNQKVTQLKKELNRL